eukprot:scaffold605372_cov34-Prasinocladus_malaysianus.AAC.1
MGSTELTPWLVMQQYEPINDLPLCAVPKDFVRKAEDIIYRQAVSARQISKQEKGTPDYPLTVCADAKPVEQEMHLELEKSWDVYQRSVADITGKLLDNHDWILLQKLQEHTSQHRLQAEMHLKQHLATIPDSVGCYGVAHRMLQAAGLSRTPGILDLVQTSFDPQVMRDVNPFLAKSASEQITATGRLWLQLCVLEDRIQRMLNLCHITDNQSIALEREMLTRRTWDVNEHPLWLVFEAEGQLQIRPKQYFVAKQLLENFTAGPIVQLNMGEGKTRVILPMLVLSWATGDKVVSTRST